MLKIPIKELKLGELRKYRAWAKDEIREWTQFLKTIEKELNKR